MMNISVLNISRIDDLTIHEHLCSQHYCHFNTIPLRDMLDALLHDPATSYQNMVDALVYDLRDTRS
jgi:hypothetical protein